MLIGLYSTPLLRRIIELHNWICQQTVTIAAYSLLIFYQDIVIRL